VADHPKPNIRGTKKAKNVLVLGESLNMKSNYKGAKGCAEWMVHLEVLKSTAKIRRNHQYCSRD
jgi:hypothetical protein